MIDRLIMPATMLIVKVTKSKSELFKYTRSMLKWPEGSVYIGYILYYPIYLLAPLPRGLEVDLEGSSIFPTLRLFMIH